LARRSGGANCHSFAVSARPTLLATRWWLR
jgi:hypothetical protein